MVNLLCILCSRIRTHRELLMIFFHDKHWYHSEPLFSVEEEDDDDDEEEEDDSVSENFPDCKRDPSPTPSQVTIKSGQKPLSVKKPEYEFLLFNYLLRFVHREGQIGDFARAGLLFLVDVAISPAESHLEAPTSFASGGPPPDPIRDAELALAEYILDGDFSEVLGAGLGAVYSLLPSKIVFNSKVAPVAPPTTGMVLGSSAANLMEESEKQELARRKTQALGVEDASNPDFKSRLDHFLKLLEFLQDVLRRNSISDHIDAPAIVGVTISQSIIDSVRHIFLENVLYPSILECSGADGSAVAVMSYIGVMIRTLESGQLADLLVDFLVNEDNDDVRLKPRHSSTLDLGGKQMPGVPLTTSTKSRRRKSSAMVLLEMEAPESRKESDYFTAIGRFTLRDLLLSNLRSDSQVTGTSALHLLQTMLIQHPRITAERLLLVIADPSATSFSYPSMNAALASDSEPAMASRDDEDAFRYPGAEENHHDIDYTTQFSQPETTYSTHDREMGLYLTLVSRVHQSHDGDAFSTGYDRYLRDALFSIQNQVAYQRTGEELINPEARQQLKHRLNLNDPVLSLVFESLRRFFANTPEFNIALTGVLATLAMHPDRSLAGWLTFASHDVPQLEQQGQFTVPGDDNDDRSIDFEIDEKLANDAFSLPASSVNEKSRPVIHTIYHGLVTQLERHRALVDGFDRFLLERRQGLLFSENMTDALTVSLEFTDEPISIPPTSEIQQPPPKARTSTTNAFVSFLTPKKSKATKTVAAPELTTPVTKPTNTNIVASPFGRHYQDTGSIFIEPSIAEVPSSSAWTPGRIPHWSAAEEDVFTSSTWSEQGPHPKGYKTEDAASIERPSITLSHLLDNIVILEESIKELVAIIHARRSLGIDSVRYV